MPRNPTTGVFTRVANSFSNPVTGTLIDPTDADTLFDDYDSGLTSAVPKEPTVVTTGSAVIAAGDGAIAIQRAAPATTGLTLPTVSSRNGEDLLIADWSTAVVSHVITLTPNGAETIQGAATYNIVSTAIQNASIRLVPSTTLSGWSVG